MTVEGRRPLGERKRSRPASQDLPRNGVAEPLDSAAILYRYRLLRRLNLLFGGFDAGAYAPLCIPRYAGSDRRGRHGLIPQELRQ